MYTLYIMIDINELGEWKSKMFNKTLLKSIFDKTQRK